jgi:uncharacterized Zn-binding protein involved in type VI secretion
MSKPVAQIGNLTSGHVGYPPHPIVGMGGSNVFIEGVLVAVEGDTVAAHCVLTNPPECHAGTLTPSETGVYVGGKKIAFLGATVDCGSIVIQSAKTVFVG